MNSSSVIEKSPHFPGLLSAPLKLIPEKMHSRILVVFLNRLLSEQINEGDLDFLEQRRLCVKVNDAGISYNISLLNGKLVMVSAASQNDLMIEASVYDFLTLAARQEDPDTLVFQRRLVMQGDTEMGLELKNFIDGLDLESSAGFSRIESLLNKSLPVYRRLFG